MRRYDGARVWNAIGNLDEASDFGPFATYVSSSVGEKAYKDEE